MDQGGGFEHRDQPMAGFILPLFNGVAANCLQVDFSQIR
jgi:hypothetical protein